MSSAPPADRPDTGAGLDPRAGDPRLACWLHAGTGPEADGALARLLEDVAWPVITRILRGKFGRASHGADAEDAASEARLQLIRYLQQLRADADAGRPTPSVDLPAYVATITYSVWANHLRRRHPARAMLVNRLRYLLENRAGPQGFALWPGSGGGRLAGFAAWREAGRGAVPSPRQRWLLTDARAAAADAFGGADRVPVDLAVLTAGLFTWLGGPLELNDLSRALVELLGLAEPPGSLPGEAGDAAHDPGFSPHETLRWKEYLGWLWRQAAGLPLGQRTAFLCHSSLLREMELHGLTSIRAAAHALEILPARMAEIWARLPLEDFDIAALLGAANRQQVINLRKTARATLGSAWQTALEK